MAPRLRSGKLLGSVMSAHFEGVRAAVAERTRPLAWCTSVGPVELLRALGFEVYFPENHGAMLGSSRLANETMIHAHALGYSPEICSYLTSDIGAHLTGKTPLSRFGMDDVPRADVLVFNTNQCREVRDWYEYYGREWGVPVVGVTSYTGVDEVTENHVDGIAAQLEALVPPLEAVAGQRMDAPALEEAVRVSKETSVLWRACLETAAHRPAPLTFFDGTIQMGPAVVLRGLDAANTYYRALLAELTERVDTGVAAVEGERLRLFWDGMPVWGRLRALSELFAELNTTVVASTYCNSWIFDDLDPADPIRSMARASVELFIVRADGPKEDYIARMAGQYAVDGLIFHDSRTCPHNTNSRFGMPGRLRDRLGLPVLTIDGDLNDLRCFSDEQAATNIEGFVEQLGDA